MGMRWKDYLQRFSCLHYRREMKLAWIRVLHKKRQKDMSQQWEQTEQVV